MLTEYDPKWNMWRCDHGSLMDGDREGHFVCPCPRCKKCNIRSPKKGYVKLSSWSEDSYSALLAQFSQHCTSTGCRVKEEELPLTCFMIAYSSTKTFYAECPETHTIIPFPEPDPLPIAEADVSCCGKGKSAPLRQPPPPPTKKQFDAIKEEPKDESDASACGVETASWGRDSSSWWSSSDASWAGPSSSSSSSSSNWNKSKRTADAAWGDGDQKKWVPPPPPPHWR